MADALEISGSWQEVDGKLKSDDWKGFNEGIICKVCQGKENQEEMDKHSTATP